MHSKYPIAVLLLLFTHHVLGADALATRQLQFAFNACERGLQSEKPESQGSFRVLQSLLKKYENNRDSALQKVPNLKDSENERYSGTLLDGKTFAEAYQICETDLYEKVATAEQYINDKNEKRKARQKANQAEVEATLQKIEQAKQEITIAVNQNCVQFLRTPETKSRHLYDNYVAAKQKALALYPRIVKQFHEITTVDPDTEEATTEVKTVKYWINLCEEAFLEQGYEETPSVATVPIVPQDDTAILQLPEIVGDMPDTTAPIAPAPTAAPVVPDPVITVVAPQDNQAISDEEVDEMDDSNDEGDDISGMSGMAVIEVSDDDEYQTILSKVQGDRLKILTTEKRLPDFNNDDEGITENATEWQYETEDGSQCITYVFKDNGLIHTKNNKGECI